MTPKLWLLGLLGWLLLGPAAPARASAMAPPSADVRQVCVRPVPRAPRQPLRAAPDRPAVLPALGQHLSRPLHRTCGAWPLISAAGRQAWRFGSLSFRLVAPLSPRRVVDGRPASPRAPPSSCWSRSFLPVSACRTQTRGARSRAWQQW